jgi:hypothetical protein
MFNIMLYEVTVLSLFCQKYASSPKLCNLRYSHNIYEK